MIRIVVPFLFMIYDSSSNQIYDFCIFTFFRNLLFLQTPYISHNPYKSYRSYRFYNLTILQTMCRHESYILQIMCRHIWITPVATGSAAALHLICVSNLRRCFPSIGKSCTVMPVATGSAASLHLYLPACCVAAAQHPHITPPATSCIAACQHLCKMKSPYYSVVRALIIYL